jgi:zeaxanthin glucosyltransferase
MPHFGVLSYKGTGHLNPFIALSRELVNRGHRVTFFQTPDLETRVRQAGLKFIPVGAARVPQERRTETTGGVMSEINALRYGVKRIVGDMEMSLRETPDAVTQARVDALIIDEIALAGPTIAQMLNLPYFLVSTSVPHNFGWSVLNNVSGSSPSSFLSRLQNSLLQLSVLEMRGPVRWKLNEFRRKAGLGPVRGMEKEFPELAHIAQLPRALDFPRSTLQGNFHYTGPFVDESARPPVDFPWDRLDGRPLIYASLGTAKKKQAEIFHLIAEASKNFDLQLVISLGGRGDPEMYGDLPESPLVVRDAPQLELLRMAEIVITHGGLNTAMEALMEGRPMIAIPLAYDQPAVAARLAWLKVAEVLPANELSAERLRLALSKVLSNASYRNAAKELQASLRCARGLERAANLIEGALRRVARGADTRMTVN